MTASGTKREPSVFWASLREALHGSREDYTRGSITRAIFLLAVPMVLEMLMESLFAIVDVFWVARLGEDSVATGGLTESILTLVYGVALGLSLLDMSANHVGLLGATVQVVSGPTGAAGSPYCLSSGKGYLLSYMPSYSARDLPMALTLAMQPA